MICRRANVVFATFTVGTLVAGCAGRLPQRPIAEIEPPPSTPPPSESPADAPTSSVTPPPSLPPLPTTVAEATAVLDDVRRNWPIDPSDPLLAPESLEDVRLILDRDQLTLFEAARSYLKSSDDPRSRPLRAQLELAWGESHMLLMELLLRVGGVLAERRAVLRASETTVPEELAVLGEVLPQILRLSEALRILSIEHLAEGGAIADALIGEDADTPAGYRLAGDYYRIIREWDRYADVRARLAELEPDSLDGLFLDAAVAMQRDGDRTRAIELYREVLQRDSNRVRAQAHLLLIQDSLEGLTHELEMLAMLNPYHQLAHWVGGFIIEAWRRGQGPIALAAPRER